MSRSSEQRGRSRPWPDDAEDLFEPEPGVRAPAPRSEAPRHGHSVSFQLSPPAPHATAETPRAKSPREPFRRTGKSAWLWGLIGFACGIVFWHLIGFWGFVSNVLLPPGPLFKSESSPFPKVQAATSNSQLPIRIAKPRLAKGNHGADVPAGPRETDMQPPTQPARLTSATD